MGEMKCPFCKSNNTNIFKENIVQGFNLIKCNDCKIICANPFKAPDASFYTNANDSSSTQRHTKLHEFSNDHPCRKSKFLKNGNGKKLLDIGCGNGAFAKIATENGFNVLGIDLDATSLSIAPNRNLKNVEFKNTLISNLAEDVNLHNSFDVITMFEVFEHLDTPFETIDNIKKLLKPNGYFIGSLPNVGRPFMWSINMVYEVPPYHLSYWVPESWESFLTKNNFAKNYIDNSNYFGYISDILYFRTTKKINNTANKKFFQILFQGFKIVIEKPIEKLFKTPAGFYFEFYLNK